MRLFTRFFLCASLFSTILAATQSWASTPVDIAIHRDGVVLQGKFYGAEGAGPFSTVILLHGFPGTESDVLGLGNKLSDAGFNTITFNYSGTFHSQGEWNFGNTQQDIHAAFEFLHQPENIRKYEIDTTRIYLGGWSFGGGMALMYAADHPEITTVFSLAGTDHAEFMREYWRNQEFAAAIDGMFEELAAPAGPVRFAPGSTPRELTPEAVSRIDSTLDARRSAPLLAPKNILIVGGWDDENVTMDHHIVPLYRALQAANAQHVRILTFQDGHPFRKTRAELAQAVITWLKTAPQSER